MKRRRIPYSAEELAWIEANKALPRKDLAEAFRRRFARSDVSQANLHALCKRRGWLTGRTGCFNKGAAPHNKGARFPSHPNSRKHQFRPGQAPHNTREVGHRRTRRDGYVEVCIDEVNPYTGYPRRYVVEHRLRWEAAHGPLPAGHVLKCLDGDKANTDPANWAAIPRALLPRLNGRFGRDFEGAPPELRPVLLKIARVEHAAREARQAARTDW
jgi:hypothetical protein